MDAVAGARARAYRLRVEPADGRVQVVAQGTRNACEKKLLDLLKGGSTPGGQVDKVISDWSDPGDAIVGFTER